MANQIDTTLTSTNPSAELVHSGGPLNLIIAAGSNFGAATLNVYQSYNNCPLTLIVKSDGSGNPVEFTSAQAGPVLEFVKPGSTIRFTATGADGTTNIRLLVC